MSIKYLNTVPPQEGYEGEKYVTILTEKQTTTIVETFVSESAGYINSEISPTGAIGTTVTISSDRYEKVAVDATIVAFANGRIGIVTAKGVEPEIEVTLLNIDPATKQKTLSVGAGLSLTADGLLQIDNTGIAAFQYYDQGTTEWTISLSGQRDSTSAIPLFIYGFGSNKLITQKAEGTYVAANEDTIYTFEDDASTIAWCASPEDKNIGDPVTASDIYWAATKTGPIEIEQVQPMILAETSRTLETITEDTQKFVVGETYTYQEFADKTANTVNGIISKIDSKLTAQYVSVEAVTTPAYIDIKTSYVYDAANPMLRLHLSGYTREVDKPFDVLVNVRCTSEGFNRANLIINYGYELFNAAGCQVGYDTTDNTVHLVLNTKTNVSDIAGVITVVSGAIVNGATVTNSQYVTAISVHSGTPAGITGLIPLTYTPDVSTWAATITHAEEITVKKGDGTTDTPNTSHLYFKAYNADTWTDIGTMGQPLISSDGSVEITAAGDDVDLSITAEITRAQTAEQENADAIAVETERAQTAEQENADAIAGLLEPVYGESSSKAYTQTYANEFFLDAADHSMDNVVPDGYIRFKRGGYGSGDDPSKYVDVPVSSGGGGGGYTPQPAVTLTDPTQDQVNALGKMLTGTLTINITQNIVNSGLLLCGFRSVINSSATTPKIVINVTGEVTSDAMLILSDCSPAKITVSANNVIVFCFFNTAANMQVNAGVTSGTIWTYLGGILYLLLYENVHQRQIRCIASSLIRVIGQETTIIDSIDDTDGWIKVNSLPYIGSTAGAAVFAGGYTGGMVPINSVELRSKTGTAITGTTLAVARYNLAGATALDSNTNNMGYAVFAGGRYYSSSEDVDMFVNTVDIVRANAVQSSGTALSINVIKTHGAKASTNAVFAGGSVYSGSSTTTTGVVNYRTYSGTGATGSSISAVDPDIVAFSSIGQNAAFQYNTAVTLCNSIGDTVSSTTLSGPKTGGCGSDVGGDKAIFWGGTTNNYMLTSSGVTSITADNAYLQASSASANGSTSRTALFAGGGYQPNVTYSTRVCVYNSAGTRSSGTALSKEMRYGAGSSTGLGTDSVAIFAGGYDTNNTWNHVDYRLSTGTGSTGTALNTMRAYHAGAFAGI